MGNMVSSLDSDKKKQAVGITSLISRKKLTVGYRFRSPHHSRHSRRRGGHLEYSEIEVTGVWVYICYRQIELRVLWEQAVGRVGIARGHGWACHRQHSHNSIGLRYNHNEGLLSPNIMCACVLRAIRKLGRKKVNSQVVWYIRSELPQGWSTSCHI
jgi:hypothetical protein